jgi:hypothetical protein
MKSAFALAAAVAVHGQGNFAPMAGYTPTSDVTAHANIALDVRGVAEGMVQGTYAGRLAATAVYSGSKSNSPSVGPLASFSTNAAAKMKGQDYFSQYVCTQTHSHITHVHTCTHTLTHKHVRHTQPGCCTA